MEESRSLKLHKVSLLPPRKARRVRTLSVLLGTCPVTEALVFLMRKLNLGERKQFVY